MNSPLITNNESLLEEQSSRFKRKLNFLIAIITIFTIIIASIISSFAILKHNIDSQSLPANPTQAIVTVCYSISSSLYVFHHQEEVEFESDFDPEPSDVDLCINSLSNLDINTKSKTNPSKIFACSLIAATNYLKGITSSEFNILPYEQLLNCTNSFNNSLTYLTNSLTKIGVDPDENILRNKKIVGDIETWVRSAESEIDACLNGFKGVQRVAFRANMARRYVKNCLGILENLDSIFNMFYPLIGSVLGSFLMTSDSFVSLGLFCSQILFLAALFCVLLRLHRR